MNVLSKVAIAGLMAGVCSVAWAASMEEVKGRMSKRVEELAPLKTAKAVGETKAGFLALVKPEAADEKAKKLVEDENADRKLVYQAIGAKEGVGAEKVGAQRAKTIYDQAAPGVMLQADDGTWYEKK